MALSDVFASNILVRWLRGDPGRYDLLTRMVGARLGDRLLAVGAGDPGLVGDVLAVRKHAGMMVPSPVQAAAIAALDDDGHVAAQKERYGRRRAVLREALEGAGFRIDDSEAGLYLWATRDEPCWETVGWFAQRGILVTPGDFYGTAGERHVRVALTASDDRIAAAAERLAG